MRCSQALSITLVLGALSTAGCSGSLATASAGQVGCAPKEIVISDDHRGWSSSSWVATCHGQRFQCSAIATGKDTSQVNCAPMIAEVVRDERAPTDSKAGSFALEVVLPGEGLPVFAVGSAADAQTPVATALEFRMGRPQKTVTKREETQGFHGMPATTEREVQVPDAPLLASCQDVRVIIDGAAVPVEQAAHSMDDREERVRVGVPLELLTRMTSAKRVAGAVCGRRWTLLESSRESIDKFLIQLNEEQALRAPAPAPTAASDAPATPGPASGEPPTSF